MTTLDEREQRTLSKRCTKCGEAKMLEEFPPHTGTRDGRGSWCRACKAKRDREAAWAKKGIPESEWPRLHKEADRKAEAQATRYNSVPDGFKRCSRCDEAKPLEEFPPHAGRRDGRQSWCRACRAERKRERHWESQGIPPEEWPRLHARHALNENMRHLNAIFGGKWCPDCEQHLPLEYFHRDTTRADGRGSRCYVCKVKNDRERRWAQKCIPESDWPRLHREADRQQRMRELAAQHGLRYCPRCDMCLPRAYFRRNSSSADGRSGYCKTCDSAREAAYSRTPAGRAAKKGRNHNRRAKLQGLPTDGTTPRDWAAWAEEHEWFQCHLCGGDLNADDEIHWDHVEPVSTGSAGTVLHNMRAAHAWCNLSRGNRPIDEWRAAMGLTEEIP